MYQSKSKVDTAGIDLRKAKRRSICFNEKYKEALRSGSYSSMRSLTCSHVSSSEALSFKKNFKAPQEISCSA
jgi:hypothetical protein